MSTDARHLGCLLDRQNPDRPAVVEETGRVWTYRELDRAADRLATRLHRWGIGRGDRVGLFLPKSAESVAAIHGILRSGAAYVPLDPTAPAVRAAGIAADCGVRAIVVAGGLVSSLDFGWTSTAPRPRFVVVGDGPRAVHDADWCEVQACTAPTPLAPDRELDDLAYILYTSGSTGVPKGVMLSHRNARCFLDWCAATLSLRNGDRFASHAPFHFDLSTFDLFASTLFGGSLHLIGESLGRDPVRLGVHLAENPVDVWYSAPSILSLLAERGGLDRAAARPRVVLFAGEVFPIRPLKKLRDLCPDSELWNLYGPTETNVCTAAQIPATIPDDRGEPYPIGTVCPPLRARILDQNAEGVGELLIAGPGVTRGYFGRPDLSARAFLGDQDGTWYRTGDLVRDDGSGSYEFRGRRDRMVKRRGYRIELGEIESALHRHDDVETAAVVARSDGEGTTIEAFVAIKPGGKASIIALKRHCTQILPAYMIPDRVAFLPRLPTTSTDKVDYQALARMPSA